MTYDAPIDIPTEQWLEILNDENLCNEKTLNILRCVFKSDNYKAYAGEIAPELGYSHHAPLNTIISNFAKRILKKYPDINPPQRFDGYGINYWHIPFLGIDEGNKFPWILRDELAVALSKKYPSDVVNQPLPEEFIENALMYVEGASKQVVKNIYERDLNARKAYLNHFGYTCVICGFNFEEVYGPAGKNIIHVHHHTNPLSFLKEEHTVDPIKDLVPVCPNCHTMIHSKKEMFTLDEVKYLINRSHKL
jgi:5-methylcytosine-specific restriction protein A